MLEWSLFAPLLLAAAIYAVLAIVSGVMRSRQNDTGAERMLDIAFLVAVAAGAWTLVLLVLAIFDQPDDIWDMVLIVLVIVVFFGILLTLLFAIFEMIFSRGSKSRGPATEEAARPDAT